MWYNVQYNVQYVLLQQRPWWLHKSSAKTLASSQALGTDPYSQLWTSWARTSWDQNAVFSRRTFIVLKASNKPVIYYWLKTSSSFVFRSAGHNTTLPSHLMLVWLPRSVSHQVHSLGHEENWSTNFFFFSVTWWSLGCLPRSPSGLLSWSLKDTFNNLLTWPHWLTQWEHRLRLS